MSGVVGVEETLNTMMMVSHDGDVHSEQGSRIPSSYQRKTIFSREDRFFDRSGADRSCKVGFLHTESFDGEGEGKHKLFFPFFL